MKTPKIHFIDSHYKELFAIKDGEEIVLERRDGAVVQLRCRFIDEHHFEADRFVYHIYQIAEIMEKNGTRYRPASGQPLPDCDASNDNTV
jgi:hypothetical protein